MKVSILHTCFILIFSVIIGISGYSQDVHFSQFDAAPLYFNPAQAGLFDCDQRIIGNYKGQWSTYNSIMISYDQPIPKFSFAGGYFGAGALLIADYAGETSYGNTLLKLMPAYHSDVIPGTLKLSAGLDIMMNVMSIDESKVLLPGGIDPITGAPSAGVDFDNPTRFYADLGLGLNGVYQLRPDLPINGGVTFFRLFGSGGGGIASDYVHPNYRRYSLNANSAIPVSQSIVLLPSAMYLRQKLNQQLNFGSFVQFMMQDKTPLLDAIYLGVWHRYGDAVIVGFAFDKPVSSTLNMNLGISYDVTVSSFRASDKWQNTKNVGTDSFEISIKFTNCRMPVIVNPQGIINDPFR